MLPAMSRIIAFQPQYSSRLRIHSASRTPIGRRDRRQTISGFRYRRKTDQGDECLVVPNRVARSVIKEARGRRIRVDPPGRSGYCDEQHRLAGGVHPRQTAPGTGPRHLWRHVPHLWPQVARGGVSFEDRQDLPGRRSGRISMHYSAAELENLVAAAELTCRPDSRKSPALVPLKRKSG